MKVKVQLLVVRIDGSPYHAFAVGDPSDYVHLSIPSEYFTDEDLDSYFKHYPEDTKAEKIEKVRKRGMFSDEQEAKDFDCNLSRVSISIEEKEIEVL